MRQSTLALICGLILFVVLAYSWCGRNPPSTVTGLPATPTPTPAPSTTTATPNVVASPSVSVAQVTATPPAQTPPPEFQKVAQKAEPAIIEITVFDAKGQLLRTGNGFFVSRDGLIVTSWTLVADAAYGVAKSPDGKIRNVPGVLASSQEADLALLRAETKTGVPFLPLAKTSESIAVNAWAVVIGSSLQHKEQPVAAGTIQKKTRSKLAERSRMTPPERRLSMRRAKLWESPPKTVCDRPACSILYWRNQNRQRLLVGRRRRSNPRSLHHRPRRNSPGIRESFLIRRRVIPTKRACFVQDQRRARENFGLRSARTDW